MQLPFTLMAAFAIVANAQWWQNSGRYSHQRKGAAQVAGSGTYGNSGSSNSGINPYAGSVNGSVPISGSGTGTGTTSNELSKSAPVSSSSDNGAGSTASFTQYGGCNTASAACGWYSSSGYNAAISQAVYGGGTGSGATAACGVCWKLTPDFPGANEIVVKVNNLCPDEGNPLCAQPEDVDINFDLCSDSGAAAALFGSSGTQQVNGTAATVDCSEWSGGADVS